ncbi:hypothetical protein MRB53_037193 [Persea americana]|nr:hypothetical protein MRB53_037193 [Persea americana]
MMAKVLLASPSFGCLSEMLSIAAMSSLQGSVFFSHSGEKKAQDSARRKFAAEEGDHLTLLNVYQTFITKGKKDASWCRQNYLNYKSMTRAVSIRNQLRRYLERFGVNVEESLASNQTSISREEKTEKMCRCLTSASSHTPQGCSLTAASALRMEGPCYMRTQARSCLSVLCCLCGDDG